MEGMNKFVELIIEVNSDTATNMVLNIKVSFVPDSAEGTSLLCADLHVGFVLRREYFGKMCA